MSSTGELLADAVARILEDLGEQARTTQDPRALWEATEEAGFVEALVAEADGGAGLSWREAVPVLFALAQQGVPSPLPEAMVARWLAAGAGAAPAAGLAVFGDGTALGLRHTTGGWIADGRLRRVPWARYASRVLFVAQDADAGPQLLAIELPGAGECRHGRNLAGEARDDVLLANAPVTRLGPSPVDPAGLVALGAALRSVQIAGAMDRVVALAVEYANLRVQFGKPIAKYQAVQHPVAVMAATAAAAHSAAVAAMEDIDSLAARGALRTLAHSFQVASAKVFCGEAAGLAASTAHQAFGAIGFTREHSLHHFTTRLWSWRDEYGNETSWSRRIGSGFCAAGSAALWPALTLGVLPEAAA